jgi:hypothetical protein
MGASAAVAVILLKEKHIVAAFRDAAATSEAAAVAPSTLGVSERIPFRRLCDQAVLRTTAAGLDYLDEPSWEALRRGRRRRVLVALLLVIAFGLVFVFGRSGTGTG